MAIDVPTLPPGQLNKIVERVAPSLDSEGGEFAELMSLENPEGEFFREGGSVEKKILERFKGRIPEEVLTTPFQLPDYTDNDAQRKYLAEAKKLFEEAGWTYKDEKLFKDGAPCVIEFVIRDKSHERFLQNFVNMLKRIGVTLKIRLVDSTNYQQRVDDLDFDMILNIIGQSNNLGNEQRNFWGSQQINSKGTYNVAGIQDPVIDELIEEIITAKTYEIQVATAKAMDRLLLWGYYMIPAWHRVMTWVAAWDKFGRPDVSPAYHPIAFETWWLDEGKQKDLEAKENAPEPVPSFVERLKTWVEGLFS